MSNDIFSSNCILGHTFTCARGYTTQEYDVTDTSLVFGTGERVIRMKSSLQTKRWTRRTNDLVSRFFAISGHRRWHTRVVQNRKSRRPGRSSARDRTLPTHRMLSILVNTFSSFLKVSAPAFRTYFRLVTRVCCNFYRNSWMEGHCSLQRNNV